MSAKAEILAICRDEIVRCTGCTLAQATCAAEGVLDKLQEPSREHGKRVLAAQEAADLLGHEIIEALKGQLLIVFVNRLGGAVTIPVAEVDGTGEFNLGMRFDRDAATFTFETRPKG